MGGMTNELGPDEYNSEFVSGGPKNYAYKIVNGRTTEEKRVIKVRGITPNYATYQLENLTALSI